MMRLLVVCGAVFFSVNLPLCTGAEKCANQTSKEVCDGVIHMSGNGCCTSDAFTTLWLYIVLGCLLSFIVLTLFAICLVSITICRFCLSQRKAREPNVTVEDVISNWKDDPNELSELQLVGVKPTEGADHEEEQTDDKINVDKTDVNHTQPVNQKPTEVNEYKKSTTSEKTGDGEVKDGEVGIEDKEAIKTPMSGLDVMASDAEPSQSSEDKTLKDDTSSLTKEEANISKEMLEPAVTKSEELVQIEPVRKIPPGTGGLLSFSNEDMLKVIDEIATKDLAQEETTHL